MWGNILTHIGVHHTLCTVWAKIKSTACTVQYNWLMTKVDVMEL